MNYEYELEHLLEEVVFGLMPLVQMWDEDTNIYSQSQEICRLKALHNEAMEKLSQLDTSRIFVHRLNGESRRCVVPKNGGHRIICLHKDSRRV